MRAEAIRSVHNQCIEVLNNSELTESELIAVLAQLLIHSGASITKKDLDIFNMDLDTLHKEYYANNKENDIGLGLVLNGASIMGAIPDNIKRDVTATKETDNDNSLSTTT